MKSEITSTEVTALEPYRRTTGLERLGKRSMFSERLYTALQECAGSLQDPAWMREGCLPAYGPLLALSTKPCKAVRELLWLGTILIHPVPSCLLKPSATITSYFLKKMIMLFSCFLMHVISDIFLCVFESLAGHGPWCWLPEENWCPCASGCAGAVWVQVNFLHNSLCSAVLWISG